jgi:hypothetical protein
MQIWLRLCWMRQVLVQDYLSVPQVTARVPQNARATIDRVVVFCV